MAATGRTSPQDNIPRAAYGSYAAAAGGPQTGRSPAAIIRSIWPTDRVSPLLLERGAVAPATTSDEAWAGALAQEATGAFFAALSPESAASRLIAAGTTIPLGRRASINFPRRSGLPAVLPWIGEGDPIPVKQYAFDEATLGPAAKFATITVLTRELAKASGAEDILAQLLREDAGASLDAAVFTDAAATDESPAGLLNGVTPITAATGGGTAAMETDLAALAGAIAAAGGSGSVAFIASPRQASAVAIRKPELKLPVWSTRALAAGTVVAVDPTAFVSGFGGVPDISTSEQATLHMESADPLHIGTPGSPATVASPTTSTWQTRQIAIRIIADVAFTMRGTGLVQVVKSVTW